MGNKLLVRSYDVGCGDCIYVRIPDGAKEFHMLIDCGSKEGANSGVMERAIKHLEENELPEVEGNSKKKRLDMIVVTHRHEDHIKGFDPKFFKNIQVGHIWITAAMDKSHKQAEQSHALHDLAKEEMRALADSGAALSPELKDLVALYGISNKGATTMITETLPKASGIQPNFVYAGQTSNELGVDLKDAKLTILAPEKDIDGFYLGEEADATLRGMQAGGRQFQSDSKQVRSNTVPANISKGEFRTLQERLLSNALAFAVDDSSIQNNVSVVLLVEWRKRRLLFVGDAEWSNVYKPKKKNGSWNVMWNQRKDLLGKPVDFLKVGHHGSHNATPWNREAGPEHEVNQIFDTILPRPKAGEKPTAKCVVSTKRKQYDTIPDAELLVEIGKRVSNTENYLKKFIAEDPTFDPETDIFNYSIPKSYAGEPGLKEVGDKGWLGKPQPMRTDMRSPKKGEREIKGAVEFVDVEIDP